MNRYVQYMDDFDAYMDDRVTHTHTYMHIHMIEVQTHMHTYMHAYTDDGDRQ